MIRVEIPGRGTFALRHLLLDMNGTLALDGRLLPGVAQRLRALSQRLEVRIATADTHGGAADVGRELGVGLERVRPGGEDEQKAALVERLGADGTVSIGNGANDAAMLAAAAIGICVLGPEASAAAALAAADVVAPDIATALDLLLHPTRLTATLRR